MSDIKYVCDDCDEQFTNAGKAGAHEDRTYHYVYRVRGRRG